MLSKEVQTEPQWTKSNLDGDFPSAVCVCVDTHGFILQKTHVGAISSWHEV